MKFKRQKVEVHLSWEALRPASESTDDLKKAVEELVRANLVAGSKLDDVIIKEIKMTDSEMRKYVEGVIKEGMDKMAEKKTHNPDQ